MEKLSSETVDYLQKLIKTCSLCGIDSVALETGIVRAQSLDNSKGTFILELNNIPKSMEFSTLGIGRVKVLGTRMSILDTDKPTFSFEGKEKDNGDIMVKKLLLSNKKTKIEFSCYDSTKLKAPKKFNDPLAYEFTISEDTLRIMTKAFAAINTSKISFSNEKDDTVAFRTTDIEGDAFDHTISETYKILPDASKKSFFHEFEIKYILPLFKAAMDIDGKLTIFLTNRGIMKVNVNGFDIYVLPEA